jgi:hypothetical protein
MSGHPLVRAGSLTGNHEAIYILDSSIFDHGDFGRLTATVNGTWLSRAELQILPDTKRFGIAGEFIRR